jgi:TldD protein
MNLSLGIAEKLLLEPTGLTEKHLFHALAKAFGPGVDDADIYLQYSQSESWILEEGLVKKGNFTIDQGVGIRAISDDKTGFAYADELTTSAMKEAACYARRIANAGQTGSMKVWQRMQPKQQLYSPINPLATLAEEEKIALLKEVDTAARKCDVRVIQVNVDLTGSYKVILVGAVDGSLVTDVRPLVRLNVSVLVEENGRKEVGSYGGGGRTTYELFLQDKLAHKYAHGFS